ncbi:hypothetical protein Tco_0436485 [Tanacetum coccineum]
METLPPCNQRRLWLHHQTRDDGQEVFMSHAWRRLFGIREPLVQEFILEFFSTCRIGYNMGLDVAGLHTAKEMAEDRFRAYWLGRERVILDEGDLIDYWVEISSGKDFLRGDPSYTYIRDPVRRLCHRLISYNISRRGQALEKYLFRHAEGRKSCARLLGGHFIGCLAHHFGLVSDDRLRGLLVVARELPLIDIEQSLAFSTIVREYVTEPSRLSKSRAELRRESDFKRVKAKEKV